VKCESVSNLLLILGGVAALLGAAMVVGQIVWAKRKADPLSGLLDAPRAQPKQAHTGPPTLAQLAQRIIDQEQDLKRLRSNLKALAVAVDKDRTRQGNQFREMLGFVKGSGVLQVLGVTFLIISIPLGVSGSVKGNACAADPAAHANSTGASAYSAPSPGV